MNKIKAVKKSINEVLKQLETFDVVSFTGEGSTEEYTWKLEVTRQAKDDKGKGDE